MRKLILILACLLFASIASAQSNMGGGGGSSSPTTSAPTFVSGASADYRPILQTSGTTLTDFSGNSKTATFGSPCAANPTWLAGGGLLFNAATSTCVPLSNTLNSSVTYEIVFRLQDPGPNNGLNGSQNDNCILGSSSNTSDFELCLVAPGTGSVGGGRYIASLLLLPIGSAGGTNTTSNDNFISYGAMMLTYVQGSTSDTFYINGVKLTNFAGNAAGHTLNQMTGTDQLTIGGAQGWQSGTFWNDAVYMVRMYPTALTQQQVTQDYNAAQSLMAQSGINMGVGGNPSTNNILVTTTDSIIGGTGVTWPATSFLNIYGGTTWDIRNDGIQNTFMVPMATDSFATCGAYFRPTAGGNVCLIEGGTNDIKTSSAAPFNIFQSVLQVCRATKLQGFKAIVQTDMAGNGQNDAVRDQYNTMIRNGAVPTCDDVLDIAANATLGADGAGTGAGFQGDHAHPTQQSHQTIMAPTISAHVNYLTSNLTSTAAGAPHVFKNGAAEIPQIIQWNQSNSFNCATTASSTPTCAFNQPVSVGSTLCVFVMSSSGTINSATDTLSGTWTAVAAGGLVGGAAPYRGLCAPNSSGGTDTVTVTLSASSTTLIEIFEIYGAASASPIDVTSTIGSGTSTTPNVANITTTVANDLIVGVATTNANLGYFSGPGVSYSFMNGWIPTTGGEQALESQLATVTGSYNGSQFVTGGAGFQTSASLNWAMELFAVKPGTFGSTIQMLPSDCVPSNPCQLDSSGGAFTFNLVDAVIMAGEKYTLSNITASGANAVTIAAINSQTINGAANYVLPPLSSVNCTAVLTSASAAGANWQCYPTTIRAVSPCISSAAPAVCGNAATGSVVIAAAGTTVTVNTTAVTASNKIILSTDDTLGTPLGVTCNSTLATLVGGVTVTARTAGTSFQITSGTTPAVNPLCINYSILP